MSLNKYIIHESSASRGDVSVTYPDIDSRIAIGQVKEEHRDVFYHWVSKKAVAHGARYQFVSQSAFPPGDVCLYDFDYSNPDGFGSGSNYDSILGDCSLIGYTGSYTIHLSESLSL